MKRILPIICVLVLLFELSAPVALAASDGAVTTTMTREDGRNWALSELERLYNKTITAIANNDIFNAGVGYCQYLGMCFWSSRFSPNLFSAADSGGGEAQVTLIQTYWKNAEYLYQRLWTSNLLDTGAVTSAQSDYLLSVELVAAAAPSQVFRTATEAFLNHYYGSAIKADIAVTDPVEVAISFKSKSSIIIPYVRAYTEVRKYLDVLNARYVVVPAGLSVIDTDNINTQIADDTVSAILDYLAGDGSSYLVETDLSIEGVTDDYGVLNILSNAINYHGHVVVPSANGIATYLTVGGYYAIAAGAVYQPFSSIAGGEEYMAVLKKLLPDGDGREQIIEAIQMAVTIKKPILYGEVSARESGVDTAINALTTYTYAVVANLHPDNVASDRIGIFVLPVGQAVVKEDGSTTDYIAAMETKDFAVVTSEYSAGTEWTTTVEVSAVKIDETGSSLGNKQVTSPVFALCAKGTEATIDEDIERRGALGGVIAVNILRCCRTASGNMGAVLFMNGMGDIVLADGTVVLPAIANPMLYTTPIYQDESGNVSVNYSYAMLEDAGTDEGAARRFSLSNIVGYYPYTASFSNTYPGVTVDADKHLDADPSDAEKYVLASDAGVNFFGPTEIKRATGKGNPRFKLKSVMAFPLATYSWSSSDNPADVSSLYNMYTYSLENRDDEPSWNLIITGAAVMVAGLALAPVTGGSSIAASIAFVGKVAVVGGAIVVAGSAVAPMIFSDDEGAIICYDAMVSAKTGSVFPLIYQNEANSDYMDRACAVVLSALRYISDPAEDGTGLKPSGTADVGTLVSQWMGQAMLGTPYAHSVQKSITISYENIVADQYNRFTQMLIQVTDNVVDTLGRISGVLAMKNGFESKFFNNIASFVRKFYTPIAIVLLIIVATKFLKGHYSAFYVLVITALTFAAFEVYAVWMPTAVPGAYNIVVNDIVEQISWNTVALAADDYANTYGRSSDIDAETGAPRAYTATITLYKLSENEIADIAVRSGVSEEDIRSGEVVFLDSKAGIFVQGDVIKMSVDKLLANNSMRGLYQSQWELLQSGEEIDAMPIDSDLNVNPYIIKLTSPYTSLEAYYTPYAQFERAFLVNLNRFLNIFNVPRNVVQYDRNLYKDSFVFSAFTNSGIFTAPGDYDVLSYNIANYSAQNRYLSKQDFYNKVEEYFDPAEDWLNLTQVFMKPGAAVQESLWGRIMQKQGYYGYIVGPDGFWTIDENQKEMIADLISYINTHTKLWVIKNQMQLNYISDENAIKLTALYAVTCFTHRLSEPGYWMYPNYLNSADIELTDVLYGATVDVHDRNIDDTHSLVEPAVMKMGGVGAVLILIIALASAIFIFAMNYFVPILYALFGGLLIFKLINSGGANTLVQGYVKVTVTTIALYVLYSVGLRCVYWAGYAWYGYLICVLLSLLVNYLLVFVVMSVIMNPLEMGNEVLGRHLLRALDGLTGRKVGQFIANNLMVKGKQAANWGRDMLTTYRRSSSIDDRHGWAQGPSRQRDRVRGYSRWEDFDDMDLEGSARVMERVADLTANASRAASRYTGLRNMETARANAENANAVAQAGRDVVAAARQVATSARAAATNAVRSAGRTRDRDNESTGQTVD